MGTGRLPKHGILPAHTLVPSSRCIERMISDRAKIENYRRFVNHGPPHGPAIGARAPTYNSSQVGQHVNPSIDRYRNPTTRGAG